MNRATAYIKNYKLKKISFRKNWREYIAAYTMILPNFLGFFIFMFIPIISTFLISFTNWDLITIPKWIGLLNYKLLFKDRVFWISLIKTLHFTLVNVPIQSFLALLIALLLNQKFRGINVFRTLFIMPWICMSVAIALSWTWILNTEFGYINHMLVSLGLPRVGWLSSQKIAIYSVIMINVWQYLGWHIILLLAALQIVPLEYYEAALVDGANSWSRFWRITVPIISPIFFYDLVVNMILTLQIFDLPFVLINGGPGNATRVYNLYLYQKGFQFMQMGNASAMGVILFFIIILFTFIAFKFFGSKVNYDL